MEDPVAADPDDVLRLYEALALLVGADTWDEAQRVVEQHPELLTDEADGLLVGLLRRADAQGEGGAVPRFQRNLALLRRCRQVGVEQAFAEGVGFQTAMVEAVEAFVRSPGWTAARQVLERHPELLSDVPDAFLGCLIDDALAKADMVSVDNFRIHRDLLRRCREVGVEQAFAEERDAPSLAFDLEIPHLIGDKLKSGVVRLKLKIPPGLERDGLKAFLSSQRVESLQEVVEKHPELLGEDADVFITRLLDHTRAVGAENAARLADQRRNLLRRCRQVGVPEAFAELLSTLEDFEPRPEIPPGFETDIQRVRELADRQQRDPQTGPLLVTTLEDLLLRLPRDVPFAFRATLLNDLGVAYRRLRTGNPTKNLQRAIDCYEQALTIYGDGTTPLDDARTRLNLGVAYSELPTGDRAANLRKAIEYYDEASAVYTPEIPRRFVEVKQNLGLAYSALPTGDQAANLRKAIECYDQALAVCTPEDMPQVYATLQNNLGTAYLALSEGDRKDTLRRAVACFEEALRFRTPEVAPLDYATTQNNLGLAYLDLDDGDRQKLVERAITCFEEALRFRTPEVAPLNYATTQNNLGLAYLQWGTGDLEHDTDCAIACFEKALRFRTPEIAPRECRSTAAHLASAFIQRNNPTSARLASAVAIRAAESLYRSAFVPDSREAEIRENAEVYDQMVGLCVILKEEPDCARDGLVYAEGGKARTFLDQMGQADFHPPPEAPRALLAQESDLILQLRQLEQSLSAANGHERLQESQATRRKSLRDELEQVWDALLGECPAAREYIALRRAESPSWEDLQRLAGRLGPEAAMIEFYLFQNAIVAFVLRAGWTEPRVFPLPIPFPLLLNRYLLPYQDEVLARTTRRPTHSWLALGKVLLEPLEEALGDAALVYFVPHGHLHLLPLHALKVHGQPFIARRATTYAPSAGVLARVLDRGPKTSDGDSALVMGYTGNADPLERELFLGEAQSVADRLGCEPLLDAAADLGALRKRAPSADRIHLSCHGAFVASDPLASGVVLADGTYTARDWMGLQLRAELITLSACESGVTGLGRGDENVGFTRSLLYAGVSSVLLTLWSVSAATTREWMLSFYDQTCDRATSECLPKAFAFQRATLALREKNPDPYYWAPFVLVGDWE